MLSSFRLQKRTQELCKSYGQDWALVFVVLVAFSLIDQLEPFHRQFSVRDITIQHPFAKQETVPDWLLLILAFVLPLGLMSLIAIFQRKSYTDLHNAFLGLFLAQSLVLIVTDSVKDVTAGSFIGITFAIFGYRQYYPSLASTNSDAPFSPRVKEDFLPTNLFERYRDDADDDLIDTGETNGRGHATATSNGGAENGQSTATRRAGAGNNRGMSGVLGQFFRQENGEPEGPGGVIKTHTKPGGGTYSKLSHTPVGQNGDANGASSRGQQQQPQQPAEGYLVNI
ncbi:hypothetical protein BGW38_001423 [Lunasporangiospora selenospora]|uniref:Uncharacterized protein n=1 Tax=Lunasporangiospora selenospora TaxID=979761 RepID=A0A9P6G3I3_9FUNG|nr:hypothetical protein BGW38_001423 [Lunasporangiospora selenospora]